MIRHPIPQLCSFTVALALASLGAPGCADVYGDAVVGTRAPALDRPEDEKLRGTMWRLAALTGQLEALTANPDEAAVHQAEIVDLLDRIDEAAASLGSAEGAAGHALVSRHGGAFRSDVRAARDDAASDPPRFERSAAIHDACLRCHDS